MCVCAVARPVFVQVEYVINRLVCHINSCVDVTHASAQVASRSSHCVSMGKMLGFYRTSGVAAAAGVDLLKFCSNLTAHVIWSLINQSEKRTATGKIILPHSHIKRNFVQLARARVCVWGGFLLDHIKMDYAGHHPYAHISLIHITCRPYLWDLFYLKCKKTFQPRPPHRLISYGLQRHLALGSNSSRAAKTRRNTNKKVRSRNQKGSRKSSSSERSENGSFPANIGQYGALTPSRHLTNLNCDFFGCCCWPESAHIKPSYFPFDFLASPL